MPSTEASAFPHPSEQWFIWAAIVVAALLVTPETAELFNLGRATAIVLLGAGLLGAMAVGWFHTRASGFEISAAVWCAFAVPIAMLLATFVAVDADGALLGPYARYTGLLPHIAYTVLFVAVLRQRSEAFVRALVLFTAAVSTIPIGYGALQGAGLDPVTWTGAELSTIFSTFGQTNFAAGAVAVLSPLVLFAAADRRLPGPVRAGAAVALLLAVYFLYEAQAFQGPVAFVAGMALPGFFIVRRQLPQLELRRLLLACGAAIVAVALVILVVPALRDEVDQNLEEGFKERLLMWDAAAEMARDDPILGKGLGGYATEFARYRPAEHARIYQGQLVDAPHSVPLRMLSEGGVILFVAYLSFVVATGAALVRALRQRGDLLTAAVGGAWLAYQVQSLVSFDVPPLAVMHWVLAGAIVLLAGSPLPARARSHHRRADLARAPVAAAAVVMVVLAIPASVPLRADIAAGNATENLNARSVTEARNELERATGLAPWEGVYWANLANVQRRLGRNDLALAAGIRAAEESPGAAQYALGAGQLASALGRNRLADHWYKVAIDRNPQQASVLAEAARWYLTQGRPRIAQRLFERADALGPDDYNREVRAARRAANALSGP